MEQEISYCTTDDGVRIAYATYGNVGLPPLVHMCHPPQEAIWASPWGRACLEALGRSLRLITLDPCGTGASQREVAPITVEGWASDLIAVVDHLDIQRFALLSIFPLDPVGMTLAARYAERVTRLALWSPRADQKGDSALGSSARANWSMYTRAASTSFFPGGPPDAQRWYSTSLRSGMSSEVLAQQTDWRCDLEGLLPRLTMPALVMHRKDAQISNQQVREVASLIPNARLVMLDGDAGTPYWDHQQFIRVLEEFLGVEPSAEAARSSGTAIILFTDIVDSTALTERLGDTVFRTASRALDERMRAAMREAGGTPVEGKVLGDGVMGVFPTASQAIVGARRCIELSAGSELRLHVGLHAGDVTHEAGNVYGGAVNIAARVCGLSAPGEVLVSATVRDLARTSAGVTFADRGKHALKGIDDAVRLYEVRWPE